MMARRNRKVTISSARGVLYTIAKLLGDVQALTSKRKGAIPRRIIMRLGGKATGGILGKLSNMMKGR